jgi:hypothetical protein
LNWVISSRDRLVTVTGDGPVARADIEGWLDVVDGAGLLPYRKLVDLWAATLSLTPQDMIALGIRFRAHHVHEMGPLAMVLPAEAPDSIERALGILAAGRRPMRLFRTPARARRWLNSLARKP